MNTRMQSEQEAEVRCSGEETLRAVYKEGYLACQQGKKISDNPYKAPNMYYTEWARGWMAAKDNR